MPAAPLEDGVLAVRSVGGAGGGGGVSSSPPLLELGVLMLLPALGHSLLSCSGVQGLSTPELHSLPLSPCPGAAHLPEKCPAFISLLRSCSDGALQEDAVCALHVEAEAELTQRADLSSSDERCMLVLGCSRTSILPPCLVWALYSPGAHSLWLLAAAVASLGGVGWPRAAPLGGVLCGWGAAPPACFPGCAEAAWW